MTPTQVRVRAQAHGGKFIGPAVAKPPVLTVSNGSNTILSGVTIPNHASGTVNPTKEPNASPYSIVVEPWPAPPPPQYYPTPGTYWLTPPDAGQADVVVSLDLLFPLPLEFRVTAFAPQPVQGSVNVLIVPRQSYTGPLGIVVPVSGLYVPDVSASYDPASKSVVVKATVQMLCGCPITQQPAPSAPTTEPYWPSNEFNVDASFYDARQQLVATSRLACVGLNSFEGRATLPKGTYDVWLSAVQPSTMNTGGGNVSNVVVP
ncbi:MAG: hypothetical protein JO197_16795 [Acidobacteria bacterium]|nr:hypothetical protein [Acidobacteriota bacterium]MBV9478519.1 hypothetical protein [Acidobacteriota bacterium]